MITRLFLSSKIDLYFNLLSLFWKNKISLWDYFAVCVCVFVYISPY
jgi:hypothetical protein